MFSRMVHSAGLVDLVVDLFFYIALDRLMDGLLNNGPASVFEK